MVDFVGNILAGFSTGLGVGFANWLFIKRLEAMEKKFHEKINNKK